VVSVLSGASCGGSLTQPGILPSTLTAASMHAQKVHVLVEPRQLELQAIGVHFRGTSALRKSEIREQRVFMAHKSSLLLCFFDNFGAKFSGQVDDHKDSFAMAARCLLSGSSARADIRGFACFVNSFTVSPLGAGSHQDCKDLSFFIAFPVSALDKQ